MSAARCGLCRWRYERTPTPEHPVTQAELQRRFYLHWREKHATKDMHTKKARAR